MYQKYTTEGFLVDARPSGEADRLHLFYTKDFGMVLAHATSVRHSKSKLRPHIQSGAVLSLTFLKSKNRWKLTESVMSARLAPQSAGYKAHLRIISVLKSLVHGEEANEALWGALSGFHDFLLQSDGADLSEAECLAMIKILHALGYGEPKSEIADDTSFNADTFSKIRAHKKELIYGINKALSATGL